MTTSFRTYYEDEDLWLYFEADDEGWAARHVEVRGKDSRPVLRLNSQWRVRRSFRTHDQPGLGEAAVDQFRAVLDFLQLAFHDAGQVVDIGGGEVGQTNATNARAAASATTGTTGAGS